MVAVELRTDSETSPLFEATPAVRRTEMEGLWLVEFDLPGEKVNKLTTEVLGLLDRVLDAAEHSPGVRGILFLSGKEGAFLAGADIDEIAAIRSAAEGAVKSSGGQRIFRRLESLKVPTLAAIHGACLGGGLELALACRYRMATEHPRTQLGLPEVKLGIIPGFGGTQRLPRRIGLARALEMILSGQSVDGPKARKMGLVDWVVPPERLRECALDRMRELVSETSPPRRRSARSRGWKDRFLEGTGLGRWLLFRAARERLMESGGEKYPAPLRALEVIRKTYALAPGAGDPIEAEGVGELLCSEVSKNLIRVYRLSERAKRVLGLRGVAADPRPTGRVGVLGAGTMGAGIAQVLAYHEVPVRLRDVDTEALSRGLGSASRSFQEAVKCHKMTDRESRRKMGLISPSTELTGLGLCDVVVESVVEDLDLKKKVLAEAESHLRENAVLASNTSSLSITEMGASLRHPERFLGIHFFNPPHRMPLVEIIPTRKTDAAVVATAVSLVKRLGKTPVLVEDQPGFLVNRILLPYLSEAALLLEEGASIQEIDLAMRDFGMPMGPLELLDEIGIDVAAKVAHSLLGRLGKAYHSPAILDLLQSAGHLGRKSGLGFYRHPRGRGRKEPEEEGIRPYLQEALRSDPMVPRRDISAREVRERLVFLMVNEAMSSLREGVVSSADDIDLALILGAGFPAFRGGLLQYAESQGAAVLVAQLEKLSERYGPRFAPDGLLRDRSCRGTSLLA